MGKGKVFTAFFLGLLIFLARTEIPSASGPINITADRLEADRRLHLINYIGNVIAKKEDLTILADRMEFYFDEKMEEVIKIIALGNVRIHSKGRNATAERAEYYDREAKVILTGNPKAWQEDDLVTGSRMTLFLKEDRSIVEGGEKERVNAVIYPKRKPPQVPEGPGMAPSLPSPLMSPEKRGR